MLNIFFVERVQLFLLLFVHSQWFLPPHSAATQKKRRILEVKSQIPVLRILDSIIGSGDQSPLNGDQKKEDTKNFKNRCFRVLRGPQRVPNFELDTGLIFIEAENRENREKTV
jgi:hypothetical protein